jgi:uncharacterized protein (DUF2147 family)
MNTGKLGISRNRGLTLGILLSLTSIGCTREQVDKGVDRVSAETHRAADKLDHSLHSAKDEAQQVANKLPSADEVKTDLENTGAKVDAKLQAAGADIKREAESVRQDVRARVDAKK